MIVSVVGCLISPLQAPVYSKSQTEDDKRSYKREWTTRINPVGQAA